MSARDNATRPIHQSKRDEKSQQAVSHLYSALKSKQIQPNYPQCAQLLEKHQYDHDAAFAEGSSPDFKWTSKPAYQNKKPVKSNSKEVFICFTDQKAKQQAEQQVQECTIEIAPEPQQFEIEPEVVEKPVEAYKPRTLQNQAASANVEAPAPAPVVAAPQVAPVAPAAPVMQPMPAYPYGQQGQQQVPQMMQYFQPFPFARDVYLMPVPPNFQLPPNYVLVMPLPQAIIQ